MLDLQHIVSAMTTDYPEYKTENGVDLELDHYVMTENGLVPVYVETDEISDEEAYNILMGVSE